MKSTDTAVAVIGVCIAILAGVFAYTYGLGTFTSPGPGMLPLLTSIFLICCNVALILKDRVNIPTAAKIHIFKKRCNVIYVILAMLVYTIFWDIGGFLLNTFLLIGYFIWAIGKDSAIKSVIGAIIITLVSYFFFKKVMGIELPDGILNIRF